MYRKRTGLENLLGIQLLIDICLAQRDIRKQSIINSITDRYRMRVDYSIIRFIAANFFP